MQMDIKVNDVVAVHSVNVLSGSKGLPEYMPAQVFGHCLPSYRRRMAQVVARQGQSFRFPQPLLATVPSAQRSASNSPTPSSVTSVAHLRE